MPIISEQQMKQILAAPAPGVYLLCGEEKLLLKRAARKLIERAGGENFPEFNRNEFPGLAEAARIVDVRSVGMGHRVCVDTCSMLSRGQGMLTGNSSAFTFLVHAETEHNEYVAARPFRVNAGGVHCYALLPGDRTRYLEELKAGDETLVVGADGSSALAVVGRVKVEARPMLYIEAENAAGQRGGVFLQNAETIRLVRPGGESISVVSLRPGDDVLCHFDSAGRHFGMRIEEDIKER